MTDITFEIPEGTEPSRCKGCKALIYWIKTRADKNMPVDPDGTSHFATCPNANKFRNQYHPDKDPKRQRQARLFGDIMENKHRLNVWETNFINSITSKFDSGREITNSEDAVLEKIHEDRI